jgi:hypothetical protein
MTPKPDTCKIHGSVIETLEIGGKTIIRLSITGGSLDYLCGRGETFHLGDTLVLDGEFRPCSVKSSLDIENHHAVSDADFLA